VVLQTCAGARKGLTKSSNPCPPGEQVYIYSESYGGKMAAQFALAIHRAQQKRHIYLTFRSAPLPDAALCAKKLGCSTGDYVMSSTTRLHIALPSWHTGSPFTTCK